MKSRIILTAALTVLGISQAKAFEQTHTMNLSANVSAYCTLGTGVTPSEGSSYFTSPGATNSTINVQTDNQGRAEAITAELTLENAVCTSPMTFRISGMPFKRTGDTTEISGFTDRIPYSFALFVDDDTALQTVPVDGSPVSPTSITAPPLSGNIRFRFTSTPADEPLLVGNYTGTVTITMSTSS